MQEDKGGGPLPATRNPLVFEPMAASCEIRQSVTS